jgi:hypothetical protein
VDCVEGQIQRIIGHGRILRVRRAESMVTRTVARMSVSEMRGGIAAGEGRPTPPRP